MSVVRARALLAGLFLLSLGAQLLAFFVVRHKIWPEEFLSLLTRVLTIYSVPMGVVLGGIVARPHPGVASAPAGWTWTALVLTGMWNLLLIGRSLAFAMADQDSVTALMSYLDVVSVSGSFLVAGVITAFFEKGAERSATGDEA